MMENLDKLGVIFGLLYIYYIAKNQKIGWIFGIISSFLYSIIFFNLNLFMETLSYIFYVATGVYGYAFWQKGQKHNGGEVFYKISLKMLIIHVCLLSFLVILIGFGLQKYTRQELAFLDTFTTVFMIYASILQARKYTINWLIFIVLNFVTIAMYLYKGVYYASFIVLLYNVFAVFGFVKWLKYDKKNQKYQRFLSGFLLY